MLFANRQQAGQALAIRLRHYANASNTIVLGMPRGGVPVAFEVAAALGLPLDVFVVRKLGVPGHEEFAFGAIASGGIRIVDPHVVRWARLKGLEIERVTQAEREELERRERVYRRGQPPLNVAGQTVILVDDGIATGSSVRAAIRALRQTSSACVILAIPVAPASTCDELEREVDELVCLETPEPFYSVGQFYADFSEVSDEEVVELLERARAHELDPRHDRHHTSIYSHASHQ